MNTCLQCHFLAKEHRDPAGRTLSFSLGKAERTAARSAPEAFLKDHYSLCCKMGVWDEGLGKTGASREETLIKTDRSKSCFFFPHQEAMLFPAAIELQKRQQEHSELKAAHRYTRIGLWIAAGALAIDVVVRLLEKCAI